MAQESQQTVAAVGSSFGRTVGWLSNDSRAAMGKRAEARRLALGLTRKRVADLLGISVAILQNAELRLRNTPVIYEAAWEALLGVPPGWLRQLDMPTPPLPTLAPLPRPAPVARGPRPQTVLEELLQFGHTDRQRSLLSFRYTELAIDQPLPTLRAWAASVGVSPARAGMILSRIAQAAQGPEAPPTPRLDTLLGALLPSCPSALPALNARLRLLGEPGLTVQGLIAFSLDVLNRPVLQLVSAPEASPIPWLVFEHGAEDACFEAVRTLGLAIQRACGAVQLDYLTSQVSRALGYPVMPEAVLNLCQQAFPFAWLDEAQGWFVCSTRGDTRVSTGVRKLLAIHPHGGVYVGDVLAALGRLTLPRPGQRARGILPPPDIQQALIRRLPGVTLSQHQVRTTERLSAEAVLSAHEYALVRFLQAHGNVGSRTEMEAIDLPGPHTGINGTLQHSPVIARLERGIYAVRGAPIQPEALRRARHSRSALPSVEDLED